MKDFEKPTIYKNVPTYTTDHTVVNSPKEHIVMFSISDFELMELSGPVPMAVQLRQKLNGAGFKFEDDGKFSSVANEKPVPMGEFISWHDIGNHTTHYKQVLRT